MSQTNKKMLWTALVHRKDTNMGDINWNWLILEKRKSPKVMLCSMENDSLLWKHDNQAT